MCRLLSCAELRAELGIRAGEGGREEIFNNEALR